LILNPFAVDPENQNCLSVRFFLSINLISNQRNKKPNLIQLMSSQTQLTKLIPSYRILIMNGYF